MPLSEHEQRLLEQMERALYAEDPKLATTLRSASLQSHYRRRLLSGLIGFALGVTLLIVGVASQLVPVSVAGFLVMLASALWAASTRRAGPPAGPAGRSRPDASARKTPRGRGSRSSLMERLDERWRRRREGDGR